MKQISVNFNPNVDLHDLEKFICELNKVATMISIDITEDENLPFSVTTHYGFRYSSFRNYGADERTVRGILFAITTLSLKEIDALVKKVESTPLKISFK